MSKLKNLYTHLIENRKEQIEGWHYAYSHFYKEVEQIRKEIKEGKNLSHLEHEDFLKKLIYEKDNGVASCGQSVLSKENYEIFIKSEVFLNKLQNFILDSNKANFKEFENSWSDQGKSKNPVRINRVAAACTRKVSTTVNVVYFKEVFSWLIGEEIIPKYPVEEDQDWFSRNTFLLDKIKEEFKDELTKGETDKFYLSIFVWELYQNMSNPFSLKKQIIKYGAPGTGKTYQADEQTSLRFDIWKDEFAPNTTFTHESHIELVQFHPSYSYEDFMEGLRPVLDDNGTAQLTLQNGIFKEFCIKAAKWEIDFFKLNDDLKLADWKSITIEELSEHKNKLSGEHWQYIFEISDKSKLVSDAVPPFFFIIDEINRAELSRVFGELMYCLEYRGIEGKIKNQYANLNNKKTAMIQIKNEYWFFIPTNIYLIGTMNTIDRSVESFDFALRRRFHWEEVKPNKEVLRYHLADSYRNWVSLADNLEKLNQKIAKEPLLGYDYQIGHAYLMNLNYDKNLSVKEVSKRIWDDNIRPLLQEYLRGTGEETNIDSFKGDFCGN